VDPVGPVDQLAAMEVAAVLVDMGALVGTGTTAAEMRVGTGTAAAEMRMGVAAIGMLVVKA